MLFNSTEFILLFLPVTFLVYFWLLGRHRIIAGKTWLVLASLFFYGWWNWHYLPLLVFSIFFNYAIGSTLSRLSVLPDQHRPQPKGWLLLGLVLNLALLGYYKYSGFLLTNIDHLLGNAPDLLNVTLPLAISFFTFTQIAYLVDSYRGEVKEYDLLNYALFVTFFPHLIAGPIIHHKEIMPQFGSLRNLTKQHKNMALGLFLFGIGCSKKVLLADTFARWASAGFDQSQSLNFFEAWFTSLSYTFQIYFDFSGYTDMAIGAALLFNIRLPANFNSPYKSTNIREFWHRWHITLSRFLRDYLYIPLGGNRAGELRTYVNLAITFVLGGLWHGPTWLFVLWGAMHGVAMVVHRLWQTLGLRLNAIAGWLLTFCFINATWVVFRAKDMQDVTKVFMGMLGMNGLILPSRMMETFGYLKAEGVGFGPWLEGINGNGLLPLAILFALTMVLTQKNSTEMWQMEGSWKRLGYGWATMIGLMASLSGLYMFSTSYSEFIYFNF